MNVRFDGNDGHDADVTRYLLLTLSGHLHSGVTLGGLEELRTSTSPAAILHVHFTGRRNQH
jgi:hypothetical protein